MRTDLSTWIILLLIFLMSGQAIAQDYPSNYRDIPCPDTGLALYQTAPEFFAQDWIVGRGSRHYAARCNYGDASMAGFWSDDIANKNIFCNWENYKALMRGGEYTEVDRTPPAGPAFWFHTKMDREGKGLFVVDVRRGGPADLAGLKVNDRILAIDGLSVSKFSFDEFYKFLQSRDEMTFKIQDAIRMVYKDLKIKKVPLEPDEKVYELYSPVHFAMAHYSYKIRKGREEKDHAFWHSRALEFLKKFEEQGVICADLDISEKGPVAE